MKGALEIPMPPTGNHRNRYTVGPILAVPKGKNTGKWCPNCGCGLSSRVMVSSDADYQNWQQATAWKLTARYRKEKFHDTPVVVSYWIYGGKGFIESRDHDNVQKCLGDAITAAHILTRTVLDKERGQTIVKNAGDDVRSIKGWRPWYYDRDEHLTLLQGRGPAKIEDLAARCFVHIERAERVQ